ncbi:MAG: hypothetical protein V9E89_19365 [Ilumatobacteraceae bacterium]
MIEAVQPHQRLTLVSGGFGKTSICAECRVSRPTNWHAAAIACRNVSITFAGKRSASRRAGLLS